MAHLLSITMQPYFLSVKTETVITRCCCCHLCTCVQCCLAATDHFLCLAQKFLTRALLLNSACRLGHCALWRQSSPGSVLTIKVILQTKRILLRIIRTKHETVLHTWIESSYIKPSRSVDAPNSIPPVRMQLFENRGGDNAQSISVNKMAGTTGYLYLYLTPLC